MPLSAAITPQPSPFASSQLLCRRYHRHLFYSILLFLRSFGVLSLSRLGTRFNSLSSKTALVLLFAAAAQGRSSSITISAIALRARALSFPTRAVTNRWHHSLLRPLVFSRGSHAHTLTALARTRSAAAVTMQDTTCTPSRVFRFCDIGAKYVFLLPYCSARQSFLTKSETHESTGLLTCFACVHTTTLYIHIQLVG
jgi:hypothetical protein